MAVDRSSLFSMKKSCASLTFQKSNVIEQLDWRPQQGLGLSGDGLLHGASSASSPYC